MSKARYASNKIGLKGVHERRGKFVAQIQVNGKKIWLGTHDTADQAYKAYCEGAKKYHGEFARFQ